MADVLYEQPNHKGGNDGEQSPGQPQCGEPAQKLDQCADPRHRRQAPMDQCPLNPTARPMKVITDRPMARTNTRQNSGADNC